MKLFRDYQVFINESVQYVATIGNFDGMHPGHIGMLNNLLAVAKKHQLPTCVIVFEPLPQEFFSPDIQPRVMTLRDKLLHFQSMGIDSVLCLRFNEKLAHISADTFIESILIAALKIKALVVGDDFRFGYQRQGNVKLLYAAGIKHNFEVYQVSSVYQNNIRISSTQIRHALKSGHLVDVKQLQQRDFNFSAKVIYGNQLGRTLGFPTANFAILDNFPLRGVYVTRVMGLEQPYYAITNVGFRPTLQGKEKRLILEAHILNFSGNLYGKRLTLSFLYKLRDEKQFSNLDMLKQQIKKDKILAEHLLTSIVD